MPSQPPRKLYIMFRGVKYSRMSAHVSTYAATCAIESSENDCKIIGDCYRSDHIKCMMFTVLIAVK
jgi:hypothetical protein